jgi:hypothetical protein
MIRLSTYLQYFLQLKAQIRTAIADKGGNIDKTTPMKNYGEIIRGLGKETVEVPIYEFVRATETPLLSYASPPRIAVFENINLSGFTLPITENGTVRNFEVPTTRITESVNLSNIFFGGSESFEMSMFEYVDPYITVAESQHPYANSLNQTWTFEMPPGVSSLIMMFTSESTTENSYDYIEITNAAGQTTRFTGTIAGQTYTATSDLTILFHTDGSVVQWGFRLVYERAALPNGGQDD